MRCFWSVGYYPWTNYTSDVTNNSKLQEADLNSPEKLKNLSFENQHLYEKIVNSFPHPL